MTIIAIFVVQMVAHNHLGRGKPSNREDTIMKVINDPTYNWEFPEKYDWEKIDSIALTKLAHSLCTYIQHDLVKQRQFVPGLRLALNEIASIAKV